jgi:DNA-binding MarR family transcriptional regulator
MEDFDTISEFQDSTSKILKVLQFRDRQESAKFNISPTQNHALNEISQKEDITMTELSDKMFLAISTMTRIVDQLVKRKLVKRTKNSKDKRVCTLEMTKEGKSLLATINDDFYQTQKEILEKVDPRYRSILLNAVKAFERATADWKNNEVHHDPDLLN